jgi:hypothetical protein
MTMARWQATITDARGNVVPGASVEVRRESAGMPLAALYSDRDGTTPLGNPFTTGSDGAAAFHAAGGAFQIVATAGAFSRTWRYVPVGLGGENDKLNVTPIGAYDSGTTYQPNDVVTNQGGSWIALQETTGNAPPTLPTASDSNWLLLAAPGTGIAANVITLEEVSTPSAPSSGSDKLYFKAGGKLYALASAGSEVVILKATGDETLLAGFDATSIDDGTKSSGTFTPTFKGGNFRRYVNGGAHTLAPPSGEGTMILQVTANGSAGTITTSGFTKVTGDTITTTSGHDFLFFVTVVNGFSHLHVQALQ